tara:strand:+ start:14632 stop:15132 length:501 start_codon:yes stop_codon:yes gene_type:complete
MADVQSNNGWTKTNLGNGWVKLTEVCDPFENGGTDSVFSTEITNSTASAVSGGSSMPIINELKAAGSFAIEVTVGAGSSFDGNTTIHMKDSAGTYTVQTGLLIEAQGPSTTKMCLYDGAITDGMKIVVDKDGGTTADQTLTVALVYYNGGPSQSDVTISGVGADPS